MSTYLSEVLLSRGNLQFFDAPIIFPTYAVKQYWHMSCHHKTSHQWLRQMCYDLFSQISEANDHSESNEKKKYFDNSNVMLLKFNIK